MKVLYVSPVFKNEDGSGRKFMIPLAGLKAHMARDRAVLKMMELGGINAPDTLETRKLMGAIRRAKKTIEKNGWYSTAVVA